jgi:uncharacterized protein (DUF2141 family)
MEKGIHFKNIRIMTRIIFCLAVFLCSGIAFAQNGFTLEVVEVKNNGGKLHISLFNSDQSFNERRIYYSLVKEADTETVYIPIDLPSGEYVFSMYQDSNGNGKLDSNFLGIPKEPFGFSNYNGKSAPGNFIKHKVIINEKTKRITIHLYKI